MVLIHHPLIPHPLCYSLFDSHCSKSLHRDPPLCFFYPYLPIRLDSIDNRDSIIDNHSDSVTLVGSSFASRGFDLHSRPFTEKKKNLFSNNYNALFSPTHLRSRLKKVIDALINKKRFLFTLNFLFIFSIVYYFFFIFKF